MPSRRPGTGRSARVFPFYERMASDAQFGGRPGKESDMAALAIRAFLGAQRATGRSAAVLFLDVRGAFYSVNRALAFPADVRTRDALRRA
eukprot:2321829-Alexandrium_andersonii.AAC.1